MKTKEKIIEIELEKALRDILPKGYYAGKLTDIKRIMDLFSLQKQEIVGGKRVLEEIRNYPIGNPDAFADTSAYDYWKKIRDWQDQLEFNQPLTK